MGGHLDRGDVGQTGGGGDVYLKSWISLAACLSAHHVLGSVGIKVIKTSQFGSRSPNRPTLPDRSNPNLLIQGLSSVCQRPFRPPSAGHKDTRPRDNQTKKRSAVPVRGPEETRQDPTLWVPSLDPWILGNKLARNGPMASPANSHPCPPRTYTTEDQSIIRGTGDGRAARQGGI